MKIKAALETQIDQKIGEVRTEGLDLSYGEIANLRREKELVIQPEYQRLFRWSVEQKSRLIESILLELPIPQIFVIENSDGVYELIDGLQRISSVLQFVEPSSIELESFVLDGCDIIKDLNGKSYADLPLSLKLRLKRSTLRTIVIKRQSKSFLRYEMFKRLNTGGSLLSPQEIRNCSARMLGEEGAEFYAFLKELADDEDFQLTTQTLAQEDMEQKANEELVLRFFAAKNARNLFRGSVRDWLDDFMEGVLLKTIDFDADEERELFEDLFAEIAEKLGENAFVKFRGDKPLGGLAPAYFEAVSIGSFEALPELEAKDPKDVRKAITELVQSEKFRAVTGPGANNKTKLETRIALARDAIKKRVTYSEQQVEQDLNWREAEMASLKLLLASAADGTDRHRALLRACSAMLYAHYEGFCKFCWTLLLDTIEAGAHIRRDLAEPLALRAMAPAFKRLRGNTSDQSLWQFGTTDFHSELSQKAEFAEEVDTQSNLWPDLAQKINDSVGLDCPTFATNAAELSQLVGRRNKIAHGEKLEIANLKQFQTFEHVAWLAMHDLALAVVDCIDNKTYLQPAAGPAPVPLAVP